MRTATATLRADRQAAAEAQGHEYLVFTIGAEEYGIDIMTVQEIRGCDPMTRIAGAPKFVRGVINLRGDIVPVVDMRMKLGLESARYDAFTVVIVLNIENRVVGMVVDRVSDVLTLRDHDIRPAPDLVASVDTRHVLGLGTLDGRMLILLDIAAWMASDDMALRDDAPALADVDTSHE